MQQEKSTSFCNVLRINDRFIKWFEENFMQANPDKFQAVCAGKRANEGADYFEIQGTAIKCENNFILLGIYLGYLLKFDEQVSDICIKASKHLAVLKRLGSCLTKQGKMTISTFLLFQILIIVLLYGTSVVLPAPTKWKRFRKGHAGL